MNPEEELLREAITEHHLEEYATGLDGDRGEVEEESGHLYDAKKPPQVYYVSKGHFPKWVTSSACIYCWGPILEGMEWKRDGSKWWHVACEATGEAK